MLSRDVTTIREAVADGLPVDGRVVLAVSGGLDSMVLLDAAAQAADRARLVVATFDHGTGTHAIEASELVVDRARSLAIECRPGRASRSLRSEADLRAARWGFLRHIARTECAPVCTAHTASDQIETVLMRILRGAGARGLAGLNAGDARRPLLAFTRVALERYAAARRLAWVEDPSNASPRFLRNRVRHDLLPALRRVRPSIDEELLMIGREAARWRTEMESLVDREIGLIQHDGGVALDVLAASLDGRSAAELSALWPAIVARVGLAVDRRGTRRLTAFALDGRVGSRVQLSGGWEVTRSREHFQLRRISAVVDGVAQTLTPGASVGPWEFRMSEAPAPSVDLWSASLPSDRPLSVRAWHAGDTIAAHTGARPSKVKHCLSAAGVTGHARRGWPVVLAGDDIVWIPGVRRSEEATARSGWPGLPFVCENRSR